MVKIKPFNKRKIYFGFDGFYVKAVPVQPEDTFRFDCLRCGTCCSNPPGVNPRELSDMAKYKKLSKEDFFNRYITLTEDSVYGWKARINKIGDECVFYSKEKGKASCEIHEKKPRQCLGRPVINLGGNPSRGLDSMMIYFEPCRGFGRGEEQTIRKWVEDRELVKAWKEEYDYIMTLLEMKKNMTVWELKDKITQMFVS